MPSKYSIASGKACAVTLDIYYPIRLLGLIMELSIFFKENDLKGLTPLPKDVELKGTPIPVTGIAARPRRSSTGFGLAALCFPHCWMISKRPSMTFSGGFFVMRA